VVAQTGEAQKGELKVTDDCLIGHWKLELNPGDASGNHHHGNNTGARFDGSACWFDGVSGHIEIPSLSPGCVGSGDFTISTRVWTAERQQDITGDVASSFDSRLRKGFNLSIDDRPGLTSSQSNKRNLFFGIDDGLSEPSWRDCGQPGNAVLVFAMCVWQGGLYVGTFEGGADERGHVYRYAGDSAWIDCGSPDAANSVASLAVHEGCLYAGTAHYHASGSSLPDSPNTFPGGKVYRYEGGKRWVDCGRLGDACEAFALSAFQENLYAIPLYSQGVYRYDGESHWEEIGRPGNCRAFALGVFNGSLFTAGNERAGVWRFDGSQWHDCGLQKDVDQVYSFAVYNGALHAGTWPRAVVYRYEGGKDWADCGRLADELEVMAMAVFNGKLYAGSLPLAQVYRSDGSREWTAVGRLDWTPDVRYRRVWSMAVYEGKLFAGVLPSGHVHSMEAGACVTNDSELSAGWNHIAAVKAANTLSLWVNGVKVSHCHAPRPFDITNNVPLRIGFGQQDVFNGAIRDFRLYGRALDFREIARVAAE